jgi:hypothetical protein
MMSATWDNLGPDCKRTRPNEAAKTASIHSSGSTPSIPKLIVRRLKIKMPAHPAGIRPVESPLVMKELVDHDGSSTQILPS